MRRGSRLALRLLALIAAFAAARSEAQTNQVQPPGNQNSLELVDPKTLRVCADPRSMPFSTQAGEGFENKIAELFAHKLGKDLAYEWYPQATGFVRMTLMQRRCDVVMGYPLGDDLVQPTNPYYRSAYALIFKPGTGLDGIEDLEDARLKDKRIGVVAGTPPSNNMAAAGLMARATPYPLVVDTRVDSSPEAMIHDLESGVIDAGVLWGPIAGYYAKQAKSPLSLVLLTKEKSGPPMAYRIVMGVRRSDQDWKRELNSLISANQKEIDHILLSYGVPLLDEKDNQIKE
ncbi:MAG: substrate-binding domain-containing protein [Hyphomicrobiales bacterium]|nr:substrate-binding domain-containing protein [Hyphomicrobiales bacterium]MBV9113385.1 substrate-binding domain-containing protein [Hyphomicrobiales bacterium]MBV9520784.1 substrate-binding domain-containing protein [Hyphomicrobiales bacterium]